MRPSLGLFCAFLAVLSAADAQSSGCQCNGPPCDPSEALITSDKCVKTPRPDCPCCLVCARLEGQECDDLTQPCDLSSNLFCNASTGFCERGKTVL